jgi:hypothetical protein
MQQMMSRIGMRKSSSLCMAVIACLLVLTDIVEAKPSVKAQSSVKTPSSVKAQTFVYQGASCSVEIPTKFTVTEKQTEVCRMFVLADSTKDKSNGVSLSISIVPIGGNGSLNELTDGVLDPFRTGLKNYKEEKKAAATINGNVFENRSFSGNFPKGTPTAGFVYATMKKGFYFVLIGDVNGAQGAESINQLLKSVKSFR